MGNLKDKKRKKSTLGVPELEYLDESREEKQKKRKRSDEGTENGHNTKEAKKYKKRIHNVVVEPESIDSVDATLVNARVENNYQPSGGNSVDDVPVRSAKTDKKKKRKDISESSSFVAPIKPSAPIVVPSQQEQDAFLTQHFITIHSETTIIPIISFDQLAIDPKLRPALEGFTSPTPIQACTWPPALDGQDVVGIAETGSGKTLAFGIPAISHILALPPSDSKNRHPPISILVLAPTRELALQTHSTLSSLATPFSIASVCLFGGVPKDSQVKTLKNMNKDGMKTRIVVGTPGRVLDLTREGVCDLSQVTYLVLDEADRMLDKGFENDIRSIIDFTMEASKRQTMMFSATWPEAVRRLANSFQRSPIRVTVGSDDLTANSKVEQIVEVFDDPHSKDNRLLTRLSALSHKKTTKTGSSEARILIFALYKKEASRVEMMLRRNGYAVSALHGDMGQPNRMDALDKFRDGTTGLLVATDVAARGLDIPNVGAVINYTFPLTIEDYIHRIGRTGRGGRTGKSITFFTGENHERALAGELARVLRESGHDAQAVGLSKFPMTIKKKTHSAYGAFFRDDIPVPKGPTKIKF